MKEFLKNVGGPDFWKDVSSLVLEKTIYICAIIIFFVMTRSVLYLLIDRAFKALIRREDASADAVGRLRTLKSLVRSIVFYSLIGVCGYMIIRVFGADKAPVLTAAGVVGLAVGFGAQKLVRDIISGFFILLENQYSVGDYATIGAVTGTIKELGMRVTKIRDDAGKLVIIANGDIAQVINHSRGPVKAVVEVGMASDSDLERVKAAVNRAGEAVASSVEGVVSAPVFDGISAMEGAKFTVRICCEVRPGSQDAASSAVRELLREEFAKADIKIV
jgi:moderate conductance mechanosensitive channel